MRPSAVKIGNFSRRIFISSGFAGILSGCSKKFQPYNGPNVVRLRLYKSKRLLILHGADDILRTYPVDLGFTPLRHKQFEGDGRTPEGSYTINRRNPNSLFHLSIGISYPNEADIAFAEAQGKSPGGEIFIHGGPRRGIDPMNKRDWTAGCISVTDRQIEEIYAMVRDGTPIDIYA